MVKLWEFLNPVNYRGNSRKERFKDVANSGRFISGAKKVLIFGEGNGAIARLLWLEFRHVFAISSSFLFLVLYCSLFWSMPPRIKALVN